jgi:hypothetical protein
MRKSENRLLAFGFTISFLIILTITILYLFSQITELVLKSIFIGFLISSINFALGFVLIKYSLDKSEKIFLMALWGGLLFRLIFGLLLVLISFIFLEINTYGFIFSVLFFYVFYLLIEIFYLNLGRKSHFGVK